MITDDRFEQLVESVETLAGQVQALVTAMSAPTVRPDLTTADAARLSGRSRNSVMDAANAGLLKSKPRAQNATHRFAPADVQAWIDRGAPINPKANR